jgi:hypothetical protein
MRPPRFPPFAFLLLPLLAALAYPAQAQSPSGLSPADRCAALPTPPGCANARNLAAMAPAADLLAGRPLAPARGPLEAAAVTRLDDDKVKDLRREGVEGSGGPQ